MTPNTSRCPLWVVLYLSSLALVSIHGSVIAKKALRCEEINREECAKNGDKDCPSTITECDVDLEKAAHCFVVWNHDNVTGAMDVKMKGCFMNNDQCNRAQCVNNDPSLKKVLFCCCNEDLCNQEHTWVPSVPVIAEDTLEPYEEPTSPVWTVFFSTASVLGAFVIVFLVLYFRKRKPTSFNEVPTMEPEIAGSTQCLTNLQAELIRSIARGRFGTVWQATLPDTSEVAVKVFLMQEKQSWVTEQDVFKLPGMNHPNILKFLGAEKHMDKIQAEFWLITAYHNHGSLCDYLKAHTVTWPEVCKIAESMARGLMHLHDEVPATKYGQLKPAIAHRDFKSKNVLLKQDLTACIADFGLALVFEPGKPCGDTHGQVGTRRYMAPEVLEGAINFTRDAFLRIDVYACGLVLWELLSRCSAHTGNVQEYVLPFESELGSHPTLDEMQENVVMKKMRPVLSNQWRINPQLSSICDTIEECWDHDAEARLSASCIKERVAQLGRVHTQQNVPLLIETNTPIIENCE